MSATANFHSIPAGFPSLPTYTAQWRAIRFELSPGTGEWMTSHIALSDASGTTVRQVLQPAALRALFGNHAKHFQSLLDFVEKSLSAYLEQGGLLEEWREPIEGFAATPVKTAYARAGRLQALRNAARQSTALCALDDLDLHTEPASIEEESKFWINRIKTEVAERRPELSAYFDRNGMLYSDSVKFGFLTDTAVAHFANLIPNTMSQSMRMARGKLQELRIGVRTMDLAIAKLVAGAPRTDDITLSDRQVDASIRAMNELRQEAEESRILLAQAHTIAEAANSVIELA